MKQLLFFVFIFFLGCNDPKKSIHKSTDGSVKEYNNWFTIEENFDKPEYKEKFYKAYNQALNQKDYKKSTELLQSVFYVMWTRGYFDEFYIKLLKGFLEKHESNLFIDDIYNFYVYIGTHENLNNHYHKCIKTLQKVILLEPYNYITFTEKGHAHYYISDSYFKLGNVDKALEENEKAIVCFNQTDNYHGQALVNHNMATINFFTNNNSEAISSIDKVIKIYKKINYIEGLVPALINKHDFLINENPKVAYSILDTIDKLIEKGKFKDEQTLLHVNILRFRNYFRTKNIKELELLLPVIDSQLKKINLQYWNYLFEIDKSEYYLLKYKKILNKVNLVNILNFYKKNNDINETTYTLKILKDEAIANNNLKKVLEYDKEIEEFEKKIQEKDFQFKVKTFEKKIDTAKKEKIIAQQQNKLKLSYIYIGILTIIFLLFVGLWRIISLKRKKNKAIEDIKLQEQFTYKLLQNTEEERNRIANELHDSVGHDLLNIKNKVIQNKAINASEVDAILNEVRAISRNLYPSVLQNLGLQISIENLCEKITNELGLFTTCDINYNHKLSQSKELQLYRIVQEALNNTIKHGKANAAKVILDSENDLLFLEIKDNGKGFNFEEKIKNKETFGLQSILQRAKAIAAKIDIISNNLGTKILLKIPA